MKIKEMFVWQFRNIYRSFLTFYGIYLLINLIGIGANMASDGEINMGSAIFSSMVYLFVIGIVAFREHLLFALGSGVSRKTFFVSFLMLAAALCLFSALVNEGMDWAFARVLPNSVEWLETFNRPSIGKYVLSIALSFGLILSGFFIGGAYYRMNKLAKTAVSITVPVLLFMGIPLLVTCLPKNVQTALASAVGNFFSWLFLSVYNAALVACGLIAVMLLLSWLLIRRAPSK